MKDLIDKNYFRELAKQDPGVVCKRTSCEYNYENKSYTLSVWGDEYSIYPHEFKINRITNNSETPHDYFYLFVIYYLLKSKDIEICNEWISGKDIPAGAMFFRGPHEIPDHLITSCFGNNLNGFKKRCEQLNGSLLAMADAAYSFKITSRIPVAVLYWKGDDEFPPEAKILFDKTIAGHLALDIIFALAVEVCNRIGTKIS